MFLFAYLSVSLIGRMRDMALALNGFSLDYICKNKTDSSSLQIPFSVIIWHFSPQMLILYKQIMLLQAQTKYTLCHLIWNINVSPNLHLFSLLILWVVCLWIIDISFWQPTISNQHLGRLYNLSKYWNSHSDTSVTDSLGSPQMHKQWWVYWVTIFFSEIPTIFKKY